MSEARWMEKNKNESVCISVNTFNGKELLDIRTYYYDKSNNEYKPTKKGISIPLDKSNELMTNINEIVEGLKNSNVG